MLANWTPSSSAFGDCSLSHPHTQIHADLPGEGVHQHSLGHLFVQGWHVVQAVSASLRGQSCELEGRNCHFLGSSKGLYTYNGKELDLVESGGGERETRFWHMDTAGPEAKPSFAQWLVSQSCPFLLHLV